MRPTNITSSNLQTRRSKTLTARRCRLLSTCTNWRSNHRARKTWEWIYCSGGCVSRTIRWHLPTKIEIGHRELLHQRNTMRTTVTLDDDAYEAAVTLAKSSGKRLGQVISDLIRRAVQKPQGDASRGDKRFPTFEVPSGAPMISLKAIRRAWEEE